MDCWNLLKSLRLDGCATRYSLIRVDLCFQGTEWIPCSSLRGKGLGRTGVRMYWPTNDRAEQDLPATAADRSPTVGPMTRVDRPAPGGGYPEGPCRSSDLRVEAGEIRRPSSSSRAGRPAPGVGFPEGPCRSSDLRVVPACRGSSARTAGRCRRGSSPPSPRGRGTGASGRTICRWDASWRRWAKRSH